MTSKKNETTFKSLPIHSEFHFAPYNVTESGYEEFVTCETFVKVSDRKYRSLGGTVHKVGTVNVTVRVGRWCSNS
jgi:hypothetical protein